ncbi:pirin family protein [Putridiphycobacter roseus]|uniref:Pirin family protein n=1 Tax=Putridiphycobacter roseus TaxID=2219161 RepID=A0A2W1MXI9_9FLAO|nr:pirin family protein [Putridiphycobacter roseus]PZE15890.1 pirin family protein [Putridiphycobacter roseus]
MNKILKIEALGFPWKTQDPFLFCAYHRDEYPKGNSQMGVDSDLLKGRNIGQDFSVNENWRMYHGSSIPGFPYHPHRGFETITINKEGVVDHTDSLGAAGRFMAGDVQWMTAGKGVQHSEMFPLLNENKDNPLEIFQVWLNLPSYSKMVEPHFKMLWNEDIPVINHKDSANKITTVEVIAGRIHSVKSLDATPNSWAARTENAVGVYTVKMEVNAEWTLPKTNSNANRSIFYYKGETIEIEGVKIDAKQTIEALAGEDILIKNGASDSYFLILEGNPIGEPVVQHGPFVMNTQEEIRETMKAFGKTQFGGWPWKQREVAHPRDKGRFALHSNGKEEIK